MKRLAGLIAVLAVIASPALAEKPKRDLTPMPKVAAGSVPIAGEYWALIIGIDKYKEAPPLETAVKDAQGVRDVLLGRYGFKRERVIELLNEQATRTRIEGALYKLGQRVKAEDSVLIYYAGHGQYDEDGRLGWWVPVEGQPKDPGTFITNASIRDYIEGMKAKHVYLVADSCFSGTLFGKSRGMPPLNEQFFARLYGKKSRWGLTSGGTEPVADAGKGGHSIFAYHFISLLKENTDPYLVPSHIFDQIAPIIANNAEQTPRSEPIKNTGDEGGQFVFRLATGMTAQKPSAAAAGSSTGGSSEEMTRMREELDALKQQMAAPKAESQKPIEEARARPYAIPRKDLQYLKSLTQQRAHIVITAGAKGEYVAEVDGAGVFTKVVLEVLSQKKDQIGKEDDGFLTATELFVQIQKKLPQLAKKYGIRNPQTPQYGTLEGEGDMIVTTYNPIGSEVIKNLYGTSYAIVIGINKYSDPKVPGLTAAVADANRMEEKLKTMGFTVHKALDQDATKSKIIDYLETLAFKSKENDRILFYFAGHGTTLEKREGGRMGYMLPADYKADQPISTAISLRELGEISAATKANHMLYLMDSAFSGGLIDRR